MARQWMPMYWGDYSRKTMHLSTIEHGAYLLLISHCWNTEQPIPDDDDIFRRITRTSTHQWNAMKATIKSFFVLQDDGWHHERVDKEVGTKNLVSTSQSSKSALRWKKSENQKADTQSGIGSGIPRARDTTTTTIEDKKERLPQTPKTPSLFDRDFEAFWVAWIPFEMPKGGKPEALKAYLKARKEIDHEGLIRTSAQYLENCRSLRCKSKHASSWLNGRAWEQDDALGKIEASGIGGYGSRGAPNKPTAVEIALADRTHR